MHSQYSFHHQTGSLVTSRDLQLWQDETCFASYTTSLCRRSMLALHAFSWRHKKLPVQSTTEPVQLESPGCVCRLGHCICTPSFTLPTTALQELCV